jgi:hypothetical protein
MFCTHLGTMKLTGLSVDLFSFRSRQNMPLPLVYAVASTINDGSYLCSFLASPTRVTMSR